METQLRTTWQQEWATLVEDIDGAYGLTVKDDEGAEKERASVVVAQRLKRCSHRVQSTQSAVDAWPPVPLLAGGR